MERIPNEKGIEARQEVPWRSCLATLATQLPQADRKLQTAESLS